MATELGKAYVQIVPSAKGISGSIESALSGESDKAGKSAGGKISSAIGGALSGAGAILKTGFTAAMAGVTAATGAVAVFGKSAIDSYASYEQLVGGVDKLYGEASGKIQQFADDAYKTSGMSANQYMETATSLSAALVNSLGGDVNKAADMTDVAMRAMSDNVNVFGSDAQSVQNAFQGFAKQNYTMLDNLKLGYGGTKQEMQRLIDDANAWGAANGQASDLSIDSFADVVQAIQQIQEKQNIAGTTAKEAMSTIEGSATAVKSAWENVITAIGRGEGIQEAFDGLASSLFGGEDGGGLLNQIIPRIQTTMEGIGQFISTAAPYITKALPPLINAVVPSLVQAGMSLLKAIGGVISDNSGMIFEGLQNALPKIMSFATEAISSLGQMLIQNVPLLLSAAADILNTIATGIATALPTLIPMVIQLLTTIATSLIENVGLLIPAAMDLIMGLVNGLIAALPILIQALPEMMSATITALMDNLPLILDAVVQIVMALAQCLIENIPILVEATLEIIVMLVAALASALPRFIDAVGQILKYIWDLIVQYGGQFVNKVGEVGKNILTAVVKFLSELPTKMAYYAGYAIGQFIKFFMELPGKIKEIWNNVITGVKGFIEDFKNKATDGGKGFFKNIIDGIKELPKKVVEIGGNIVKGIWQGISDGWTWLTDSIKNLADNLLQGVKDALGIESPSKEFAWVGKMVDEGFAKGLTDNAYLVDSAMSSLNPSINGGSIYATLADNASGFRGNATINVYPSAGMNERELAQDINYYLADQKNRRRAVWGYAYG